MHFYGGMGQSSKHPSPLSPFHAFFPFEFLAIWPSVPRSLQQFSWVVYTRIRTCCSPFQPVDESFSPFQWTKQLFSSHSTKICPATFLAETFIRGIVLEEETYLSFWETIIDILETLTHTVCLRLKIALFLGIGIRVYRLWSSNFQEFLFVFKWTRPEFWTDRVLSVYRLVSFLRPPAAFGV